MSKAGRIAKEKARGTDEQSQRIYDWRKVEDAVLGFYRIWGMAKTLAYLEAELVRYQDKVREDVHSKGVKVNENGQ